MKSLVCLIVVLSLIFDAQSIHIKDPDPRVLFQFSQGNPAPGGLFTNSEICEGLVDFLRVFGTEAVSSYSTCQDQYILLGEQNSLIKEDQPACFLNLVPALCQYRIDTNVNEPHPSDLRYFITKTIQNCIKTKSEYTTDEAYICPTLNMQTQQVEEKEDFCKNLEAMNQYDPDLESDPTYKVYGFIGRDAKTPCVQIVELYNFCIFVTQKLNLDTDRCFTNKFTLYEDGGSLQKYGPQDMNICATLMLPYFSHNSIKQNILDPMNTFGFCDQINNRIVLGLEARQGEIKQELTYQRGNQSIYEQNIEKLNDWKTNVPTIVDEISKIEEQWTSLYKFLTKHDTINATNVTIIAKSNIDLLNNTLADWVMTSRSSLGFMKSFENDTSGASLLNYGQVSENFNKIHLLSNHTLNFATFINQLMTNEVDDNSADNMVSKEADQTVKSEDLKAENVLFYEGKSNYGNFLTGYMGQTSKEAQINENKVNECKEKIEKLTKSLDAVFEQEQLSYKYFY